MLNFPNAKINLGLQITEKRADGYHNIDSCFYPIPMHDVLEINEAKTMQFKSFGLEIPGKAEDNLIWKAYQLLKDTFNLPPVEISLYKNIPMGAGMGGGSADGAFMLKLLNDQFQLKLTQHQLEEYALQLGSDCPFFVDNLPKHVLGRGEILSKIKVDLSDKYLALIFPGIHIGTKEAYSSIKPIKNRPSVKDILESNEVDNWKELLHNDFEDSVFKNHPQLEDLKGKLYNSGAIYAAMTGSGSTLFGIFDHKISESYIDSWIQL